MERNYPQIIAALRRKANDPGTTPEERDALNAKASELAVKYGVVESNRDAANGEVPTWEELVRKVKRPPATDYVGVQYTRWETIYGMHVRVTHITTWANWLGSLDEEPLDNGNYEFPQEEGGDNG